MKKRMLALCVLLALIVGAAAAENTGLEANEYYPDNDKYPPLLKAGLAPIV